jgi:putative hemolysin
MISKLDRIPEENEDFSIDYCGYNFKILEVKNKMITSVLVTRLPENTDKEEAVSRQGSVEGHSSLEEIKE